MLKTFEEMNKCKNTMLTKEYCLWNIARELSRRNDLLEVDALCKTADSLRNAAKTSLNDDLYSNGWSMAEELSLMAQKKISQICALSESHGENVKNEAGL